MADRARVGVKPLQVTARAWVDYNAPPFPADAVSVSDSVSFSPVITKALNDTVSAAEAVTFFANNSTLDDGALAVDSVSIAIGFARTLSDAVTVTELNSLAPNLTVNPSDSAGTSDGVSFTYGYSVSLSDSVTPAETGTPVLNAYESETNALVARMTTAPDDTRKGHINTLIAALKTAGVWTKLDVLVVFAAHDSQAAKLNWKSTSFNASEMNSPSFAADRGFTGNGSTSYLKTNYTPSTDGVQYTINSAYAAVWCRTSTNDTDGGALLSMVGGTSGYLEIRGRSQDTYFGSVNQTSGHIFAAATDGKGWWAASRTGSTSLTGYRNTTSLGTSSTAVSGLPDAEIFIGARHNGGGTASLFSDKQIAAYAMGGGLTLTEHTDFYNAMNTYMTAVGAAP